MSLAALDATLRLAKPGHTYDSAYSLSQQYRISQTTAVRLLEANGYTKVHQANQANQAQARFRWVKQETQLDRVERKLDLIIQALSLLSPLNTTTKS